MKQFEVTARLGAYLSGTQEKLVRKPYNGLELARSVQTQEFARPKALTAAGGMNGFNPPALGSTPGPGNSRNQKEEDIPSDIINDNDKEDLNDVLSEIDTYFDQQKEDKMTEELERKVAA
jgi:hypothetical protein